MRQRDPASQCHEVVIVTLHDLRSDRRVLMYFCCLLLSQRFDNVLSKASVPLNHLEFIVSQCN